MNKLEITKRNEEKILNSFYSELKEQGFSFSIYDGELFNKVSSVEGILDLYHNVEEMIIRVKRGNYKASASFIFGNGEDGIYCMYDYSYSLQEKNLLTKTFKLIDKLADERCERLELKKRNQSKEKEKLVIEETIAHLTKHGFKIQTPNGSKFDMQTFLNLHAELFEKNYDKDKGEKIFLKLLDAKHQEGFISFMPSSGYFNVVSNYSNTLSEYMPHVMNFAHKIKYSRWNDD